MIYCEYHLNKKCYTDDCKFKCIKCNTNKGCDNCIMLEYGVCPYIDIIKLGVKLFKIVINYNKDHEII